MKIIAFFFFNQLEYGVHGAMLEKKVAYPKATKKRQITDEQCVRIFGKEILFFSTAKVVSVGSRVG